jgi:hypothetical protein|tara:strand:+ start:1336 stop:1599 length:264 start_codon:yes stop_codon:yes gene_type:complete
MGLLSNLFGRGSADAKLQDQIFNLKFTAKSLARAAKKCEAEERANKSKVRVLTPRRSRSTRGRRARVGRRARRVTGRERARWRRTRN